MENVRKVFDFMFWFDVESATLSQICKNTKLSPDETIEVIESFRGIFDSNIISFEKDNKIVKKVLYSVRKKFALKSAYHMWKSCGKKKYSLNMKNLDRKFFEVLTNPLFDGRSLKSIVRECKEFIDKKELVEIINYYCDLGVIFKRNDFIKFTRIGLPIYSEIMIYRIFIDETLGFKEPKKEKKETKLISDNRKKDKVTAT